MHLKKQTQLNNKLPHILQASVKFEFSMTTFFVHILSTVLYSKSTEMTFMKICIRKSNEMMYMFPVLDEVNSKEKLSLLSFCNNLRFSFIFVW